MPETPNTFAIASESRTARFGPFELSLATGELRKHGVRIRLQGKPFQILLALIEAPGQVVTREQLRARVWPADTFVDFESGLNTAVNRLRIALGDSAASPIYIETLARLGYRFIAQVELSPAPSSIAARETPVEEIHAASPPPPSDPPLDRPYPKARFLLSTGQWVFAIMAVVITLTVALGAILPALQSPHPEVSFHQLTFRKGYVSDARFTPDGRNLVYSARWNADSSRVYLASMGSPETRDVGLGKAWLASVSANDELALFTYASDSKRMVLQRTPLNGGAPRLVSDGAAAADWSPNGTLCVVTSKDNVYALEFPIGHKIYVAHGYITDPRVSPEGDQVAFLEHPVMGDDAGQVVVVNSSGQARVLSSGWASAHGLAWNPSTQEVWFTAVRSGANRVLMAVSLRGRLRQISQVPGGLELKDINRSGKVLIARNSERLSMFFGNLNEDSEQDISWLDRSRPVAIRADGKTVLFDESGEGGGRQYSVYLYQSETHTSERLGDGKAVDLSADGQWALTQDATDATRLSLVSVNAAQRSLVPTTGLAYRWAKFFPNGKEILFAGSYPKQPERIYRQSLPDGRPIAIASGLQWHNSAIDAAGETAAGCAEGQLVLLTLKSGAMRPIYMPQCGSALAFSDPRTVLVSNVQDRSFAFEFVDIETGRCRLYRRFTLTEPAGTTYTAPPYIARDLQTFVYCRAQDLSDLFVVSGWT